MENSCLGPQGLQNRKMKKKEPVIMDDKIKRLWNDKEKKLVTVKKGS